MPREKIDHRRALMQAKQPQRSMSTALVVGEQMTLAINVSGVDLLFGLQAKSSSDRAVKELFVDNVKIALTISTESGRGARVRVQAPDSVRILKPAKAAA